MTRFPYHMLSLSIVSESCSLRLARPALILEGKQDPTMTLARVLEPFPMEWKRQAVLALLQAEE